MTAKIGHAPIEMRKISNEEGISKVGDYYIRYDEKGPVFVIAIPYRSGKTLNRYTISEWTINHKNHCNAEWTWDFNENKPTLHPSLHAVNIWHGWVKNGMLVEA